MKRIDPLLSFVSGHTTGSYDPTVDLGEPIYHRAGFSGPDGRIRCCDRDDAFRERYFELDLADYPRFDPLDAEQIKNMFSLVRSHVDTMKYSLRSQNGFSSFPYYSGQYYTGELDERGRPDGKGELTESHRLIYAGQWQRGLPNGEGTFY